MREVYATPGTDLATAGEHMIRTFVMDETDYHAPYVYTTDAAILYIRTLFHLAHGARHILELGTGPEQLSTCAFSVVVKITEGHVWTVDIEPRPVQYDPKLVTYITGRSVDIPWDHKVDLLYVDSDHDPAYMAQELDKFGPWVWRGGRIVMDDMRHKDEPRLEVPVDAFCKKWGLTWNYAAPLPNKIGLIEVTQPIG